MLDLNLGPLHNLFVKMHTIQICLLSDGSHVPSQAEQRTLRSQVIDPALSSRPIVFRNLSSFILDTRVRRRTHPFNLRLRRVDLRPSIEKSRSM
jgi:hypothetical protein